MKTRVKFLSLMFCVSCLAPWLASAQTAEAVSAEGDLLKAYQREYAFLAAQKESLRRQAQTLEQAKKRRRAEAEAAVRDMEIRLMRAQADNERLFDDVQMLEQRKKEGAQRGSILSGIWKKMQRSVQEHELALALTNAPIEDGLAPEQIEISDLAPLETKALALLRRSTSVEQLNATYLNETGELVDGPVLRIGRVAAFALREGLAVLLAPRDVGRLGAADQVSRAFIEPLLTDTAKGTVAAGLTPLFAYESLKTKASFQKPAGWMERIADIVPIAFLGLLFTMIAWLFMRLAKV